MKRSGLLALLTTGHAFEHWYLGLMGPLMPFVAQDLNFNLTQVGILVTGRALFGAFSSAASGWAADRLGSGRGMLIFCLVSTALLYAGIAMAPGFSILAFIFWASGLSGQTWHPPAMGLLGEQFRERKGFAFGVHGTGATVGQSIAPLVAGYMLLLVDWRQVILWNTLPMFAVAAMLAIWLPSFQPPAAEGSTGASFSGWLGQVHRSLIQNPRFMAICCASGVRTLAQHAVSTFLPFLLVREFGAGASWVGFTLAVFIAACILPETLMGYLSDRVSRQNILLSGMGMGALLLFLIPAWGGSYILPILLALLGGLFISMRSVIFAAGIEISPRGLGGSVVGIIFMTNQIFVGAGALAGGILADMFGPKAIFWFIGGLIALFVPINLLLWKTSPEIIARSAAPEAGPAAPSP